MKDGHRISVGDCILTLTKGLVQDPWSLGSPETLTVADIGRPCRQQQGETGNPCAGSLPYSSGSPRAGAPFVL